MVSKVYEDGPGPRQFHPQGLFSLLHLLQPPLLCLPRSLPLSSVERRYDGEQGPANFLYRSR